VRERKGEEVRRRWGEEESEKIKIQN